MAQICSQFGISRQAHDQKLWRETERQTENEIVLEMVRQVRRKHPRMGGRKLLLKIQPLLATEQLQIGRDRLFELLRSQDLLIKRRKTYRRTTIPGLWRAPNRLPGLTISHPNQVWVCYITYLELAIGHFAYLFVLMDLFARYILGWHVATSLAAEGALISLQGVQPDFAAAAFKITRNEITTCGIGEDLKVGFILGEHGFPPGNGEDDIIDVNMRRVRRNIRRVYDRELPLLRKGITEYALGMNEFNNHPDSPQMSSMEWMIDYLHRAFDVIIFQPYYFTNESIDLFEHLRHWAFEVDGLDYHTNFMADTR